ncbi:carbohydrate ABC transporter permease [Paenibacillus sp.]|jgi:putative aldouronate transport system permease protein|uniref:carbohydrate ABC transporter permease n=1 Tax=Paenibacillus sp. TaxID=58172 RepID=UPI0028363951|nr:carbohydrate ABC transporter permease [Paenibacillus sp.]MDR0271096.1 carbohydrate ABC transporter permease [Paenibacillus sp.]
MNSRTIPEKIWDCFNVIALAVIAGLMLLPFIHIFAVSFSSLEDVLRKDFILWPTNWTIDSYKVIFLSKQFIGSLGVTVTITVIGTLVSLILTASMAYALTRNVLGQRVILIMVIFTILFNAGMIPVYLVVKSTGLINSLWALIIPGAISSFNLIVIRQFFLHIPSELSEAALIDGANEVRTFWSVILPLSKPALATFALFYAVGYWNKYFEGILYLNDVRKWPVQVVLRQMVIMNETTSTVGSDVMLQLENQPPPVTIQMAAILVATLPILVLYPFLQKHFAKGVMIGSVKG